jgi:hypothetical protein
MSESARLERDGTIRAPGLPPARVLSWNPPLLVLEREGEVLRVFLAAGERGGGWIGLGGATHPLPGVAAAGGEAGGAPEPHAGDLTAPMPGRVIEVLVAPGEAVEAGQRLLVLEAMKMETPLRAPARGTVRALHVAAGSTVEPGQVLVELEAEPAGDATREDR